MPERRARLAAGGGRRWPAAVLRIVGVLVLLSALALAMSRAPDRPVGTLVARWAMPPSDFIEVKGQVVHFRDQGPRDDPVPVVLIHGTSASLHTWEGWVEAIARKRRVVTFDLPGFGLTGPFTGQYAGSRYGGDDYARFVIELLDALDIRRAVVGGNSLGGEVAWRMALMAPERVDRLVLVDAAGLAFEPESMPAGFLLATIPGVNRLLDWVLPRAVIEQSLASVYGDPSKIRPELVDRYFELALREGNRRALVERLQTMRADGGDDGRIAGITQATLILWGGRDRLIPPAVGRQLQSQIAGSRLVVFDDLGHVPQEEDPARTVAPVLDFIDAAR